MKLLFTAFDRDLLTGCAACLRARGYEVTEAFDCPSAVELASSERFDAAIVDISRRDRDVSGLQRLLLDSDVPVIALTEKEDSVKRLTSAPVACSYLCHPFTPDELALRLEATLDKAGRETKIGEENSGILIRGFTINNKVRVTGEEIELLTGKADNNGRDPYVYVLSLEHKLRSIGSSLRITYEKNEGYRLVDDNE